jgi:hypothetical protein
MFDPCRARQFSTRGFAPRTPLHALSLAASPRSLRSRGSLAALARGDNRQAGQDSGRDLWPRPQQKEPPGSNGGINTSPINLTKSLCRSESVPALGRLSSVKPRDTGAALSAPTEERPRSAESDDRQLLDMRFVCFVLPRGHYDFPDGGVHWAFTSGLNRSVTSR